MAYVRFGGFPLTLLEAGVLRVLLVGGPQPASDIAIAVEEATGNRADLLPQVVRTALRRLEARGLAESILLMRQRITEPTRSYRVTDQGTAELSVMQQIIGKALL